MKPVLRGDRDDCRGPDEDREGVVLETEFFNQSGIDWRELAML